MSANDVVITGIGLVSSLGEGAEAHWRVLSAPGLQPVYDATKFAPHVFHPLPELDWNLQIPKRSDQRQMELWQRLGTYTAGLALQDAGLKGDKDLLATTDMIIAAGGGERDETVDEAILDASRTRADHDMLLNEKLTTELRPTLFLAQLSNLLAGNISIVHNVTGSSRTFMGEEGAGISALSTALARIRSGQSQVTLVGGAFQSTTRSMLMGFALGGRLHEGEWAPVWARDKAQGGGMIPGSGSAFLVLEARQHAEARSARIYGRLDGIASARSRREADALSKSIGKLVDGLVAEGGETLVISGASGVRTAVEAERQAFAGRPHLRYRGLSSAVGYLQEGQFPFAVALAALAIGQKTAYPSFDDSEPAFDGVPQAALATIVGYGTGEGAALVTAV